MRVKIAIFFSILFISALTVPTLIIQTDDFQEIAILLDMNEEEENKGKEGYKVDSKLKIWPQNFTSSISDNSLEITKNIQFYSKNYASRYPTVTTPPPQ